MTTSTAAAINSRSYSAEARHPAGTIAGFSEDIKRNRPNADYSVWTPFVIPAGAPVQILGYVNAGFRGIEVSVMHDGHRVHGISAGLLA